MSRSSKKGPYVDQVLLEKIMEQKRTGDKKAVKTWSRSSQVPPEFVGHKIAVHKGNGFTEVLISENMVGHRLGEFAPTRTFRGHGRMVKRIISKT